MTDWRILQRRDEAIVLQSLCTESSISIVSLNPSIVLSRTGSDQSVLTDGGHTIGYLEAIEMIEVIARDLRARGVQQDANLDFRCEQGLSSALLWLTFLESGWSFFVNTVAPCIEVSYVPDFCRFSVKGKWIAGCLCLEVIENPGWNGAISTNRQTVYFQTSGTTGKPKLVAHSVVNLLRNASNCVDRLKLKARDRIAVPVPLYHMFGLGAAFLPGALAGASVDIQVGSNLLRFIGREKEFDPNVAFLTPTFMETLVRGRRSARKYDLTVSAGDLLKPDLFESYEERFGTVVSLYGSTELGAVAASSREDSEAVRAQTVGQPMQGVECRIDDGQLRCRHESGFIGYADDTGRVDEHEEWFPTRDLAEWQYDNCLRLFGRLDHSVNRDGVLVALGDVERQMDLIDGVESAKVVAAGQSPRGKGIVAFCILKTGAETDPATIRQACFEKMRRGHVPDRVEIVDRFPQLLSGKPDRSALGRLAERKIDE